jgi:hypothetical protein
MTTEEIIYHVFCEIDDRMPAIAKHPQAKLYPSELVTIGVLYALKGGRFRAFYRWLKRDYDAVFGGLPDRTRLLRGLNVHQDWCDWLLAEPSFFMVIDSYPIELIFPIREGRSPGQAGGKCKDKGRWTVGIRLCWLLNDYGQVVGWAHAPLNVADQNFQPLIRQFEDRAIVLADSHFHAADGDPTKLKICARGTWTERMLVETALSLVTVICDLKHLWHRLAFYIQAHLAYAAALFNVLLRLFQRLHPDADPFRLSIAEFSL